MQDNEKGKNQKAKKESESKEVGAFETFALAGGKRNPKSGATIPPVEGVVEAKKFVEENKK